MFDSCDKCGSDTHNAWAHEEIERRVRSHIADNLRSISRADSLDQMMIIHFIADGIENYEY